MMAGVRDHWDCPDDWYCEHDGCRADGSGETWAAIEEHLLHHREADALALLPEVLLWLDPNRTPLRGEDDRLAAMDRIRALIGGE